MDQYALRHGVRAEANLVHHILPAQEYPEYQWKDWNLISVSESTHKHLHEKYTGALSSDGWELARETAEANGVRLTITTLVIGMPGTGKSTWTRSHLGSCAWYGEKAPQDDQPYLGDGRQQVCRGAV